MTDQPVTIPVTRDTDLTATAELIADLRAKNADLEHQLAVLRAERIKPIVPQYEVSILYSATPATLQTSLNDSWHVLHMQFDGSTLNVVMIREQSPVLHAGDRPAAGRLVQPVPGTHRVIQSDILKDLPLAQALRRDGLQSVLEQQNAEVLNAGQQAFDAALAANPPAFTAIPARVPGKVTQ